MSKAITICTKNNEGKKLKSFKHTFDKLLSFENFTPNKSYFKSNEKTLTYIYNPEPDLLIENFSHCMGLLIENRFLIWRYNS